MLSVPLLVEKYKLLPHPEGGFYKENYRAAEIIPNASLPKRFHGDRNYSTAIYFLLEAGDYSAFHKISSDECWHFYSGCPLLIYIIHINGKMEMIKLGNDILQGEQFQAIVPAQCWFASEPAPGSAYSFVGCTVAPGFDFDDFELAKKEELSKLFPQHGILINRLTR